MKNTRQILLLTSTFKFKEEQPLPPNIPIDHQYQHLASFAHFNASVEEMMRMMLSAKSKPLVQQKYNELYTMPWYRRNVTAKLKFLKSQVNKENVERALKDNRFWRRVLQVFHTYPQTGGRNYLFLLVGKFHKKQSFIFEFNAMTYELYLPEQLIFLLNFIMYNNNNNNRFFAVTRSYLFT